MTNSVLLGGFALAWVLANYVLAKPETRRMSGQSHCPNRMRRLAIVSGGLSSALLIAFGFAPAALALAGWLLAATWLLHATRRLWIGPRHLAEFESVAVVVTLGMAYWLAQSISEARTWVQVPGLTPWQMGLLSADAALLLYAARAGSWIVRGILEKGGGAPEKNEHEVSTFRHGEIIGQVERLVVILVLAAGSPQALAFFFAAKGLIRSKELENRAMADYFLLGSLASFLVATVCGLILVKLLLPMWK